MPRKPPFDIASMAGGTFDLSSFAREAMDAVGTAGIQRMLQEEAKREALGISAIQQILEDQRADRLHALG